MSQARRLHITAALQALFVTFLWSTSWVLIKLGLEAIPALTFAGTRYFLAFLVLLPLVFRRDQRAALSVLERRRWIELAVLGLLFYTLTQGAMFMALAFLPAMPISLILSFSPAVVALLAIPTLAEFPTRIQWVGMMVFLSGVLTYFAPFSLPLQPIGLAAALIALVANAVSSVVSRSVNRRRDLHPLSVTVVSMGIGSIALLGVGLAVEGLPHLNSKSWSIITYLAVVNTAVAFTLWNHTLRQLTAMESSILNNTMLIQIAILAWLVLGEPMGWKEALGIAMAAVGALLVQLRRS